MGGWMDPHVPTNESRVLVVGAGMMGRAVAQVTAERLRPERLIVVDLDREAANRAAAVVGNSVPVKTDTIWSPYVEEVDAAVLCVPWGVTADILTATARLPITVVGITRPPADQAEPLPVRARARRGPAVLPVGLEPGLTEIVLNHVASAFDAVRTARLHCGGLTSTRPTGFPYRLLFNGSALPFADRPAYQLVGGVLRATERFSGLEPASLPGLPDLESYHDGMVPWLADVPALRSADVQQRTVRWPGFVHAVRTLHDAGLLSDTPCEIEGTVLRASQVTNQVLGERIRRGPQEREVTHLEVSVTGTIDGLACRRTVNIWCTEDAAQLESGMAVLTAVTAVEALATVPADAAGWVRPERLFQGDRVAQLANTLRRYGANWHAVQTEG